MTPGTKDWIISGAGLAARGIVCGLCLLKLSTLACGEPEEGDDRWRAKQAEMGVGAVMETQLQCSLGWEVCTPLELGLIGWNFLALSVCPLGAPAERKLPSRSEKCWTSRRPPALGG